MKVRHAIRRMILGALVVLVAMAAVGSGQSARAGDNYKVPDFKSRESFKWSCEKSGGTFIDDGIGNIECHWDDGSWTECDENAKDCYHTEAPKQVHSGNSWDPYAGAGGEATADGGDAPPAADHASPTSAQPSVTAGDDDQDRDHGKRKGKGKKGKKGKKGGKGRR